MKYVLTISFICIVHFLTFAQQESLEKDLKKIMELGDKYEQGKKEYYGKYNFELKNQSILYRGELGYTCTRNILFKLNSSVNYNTSNDNGNMSVCFARQKDNSGIVYLSIYDNNKISLTTKTLFKGNIYLYLDNGDVIKCLDRKIIGYTDNISSAMYFLTKLELEKLKKLDIKSIAFSTIKEDDFSTYNIKNHKANNKQITKIAVQALFNE
ncbi:hypothetical protein PL373_18435 [Tenacibaculum maritimum]|nr:hypothetical protein [Tenacibaculum maritimum]MDB0603067.1 hypothetical protein [Tenacibaculum maritimum]MDB0611638.1 hypothetical protein [Tenacibaculum maritimum]